MTRSPIELSAGQLKRIMLTIGMCCSLDGEFRKVAKKTSSSTTSTLVGQTESFFPSPNWFHVKTYKAKLMYVTKLISREYVALPITICREDPSNNVITDGGVAPLTILMTIVLNYHKNVSVQ